MLLNAVIICCIVVVNAEPPLNSYSLTGDNNGYDYSNTDYSNAVANNGYLGSKDSYLSGGSFYNDKDTDHKLSNHIGSHSLIDNGNQANIGNDMRNGYSKYPINNHEGDYTGYSKPYENPDGDSYSLSNHAASIPFRGYSSSNNNIDSKFNVYSGGPAQKDSDFGQYAAGSNSQRIPPYSGYQTTRPAMLENHAEGTSGNEVRGQGFHGSFGAQSYSENDHIYAPYPADEYPFRKQKDGPYSNLKGGGNKYNDIHSIPSEIRYTRGNTGHTSYNHDVSSPYLSGSGPSGYKTYGSAVYYSAGKPYKYGYKYSSRYVPNSGVSYLTRERDSHYAPYYGKGGGKVIIIKDSKPSYTSLYSDEPSYIGAGSGYRSKGGGFMSAAGYSASPNFDGYGGTSGSYADGPAVPRRYRTSGLPMLIQKTVYS